MPKGYDIAEVDTSKAQNHPPNPSGLKSKRSRLVSALFSIIPVMVETAAEILL